MGLHAAGDLGDHEVCVPDAQADLHLVNDAGAVDAEPLLAAARALVDQDPGEDEAARPVLGGLDADRPDVQRDVPFAHRAPTSSRTFRISSWMTPFDARIDGAERSSGPPDALVTRPPASSTRSEPAAMSQAPRLSSQKA